MNSPEQDPAPLHPPVCTGGAVARGMPVALNSQTLLRGQKTVEIEHNGERYRLQNTRAGKLILTK